MSLATRLAAILLLALPLAGCEDMATLSAPGGPVPVVVPQRPAAPPPAPVVEAPPLADLTDPEAEVELAPAPTGEAVVVIPSTPVPAAPAGTPAAAAPAPAAENPLLAQQRAACAREGGRLQSLASGLVTCIRQTGDAGRACTGASDCEGVCLARSGTCAPITPLYGCHEVLLSPGSRVTQCLD
jgi:hypothetical protein